MRASRRVPGGAPAGAPPGRGREERAGADSEGGGAAWEHPLWFGAGALFLVLAWSLGAMGRLEYVMPGPLVTWRALWSMMGDPAFWSALWSSLSRALLGLLLALVLGLAWGGARGRWRRFASFTHPLLQLMLSTPAIIFVILVMLWLGVRGPVVPVVVAIVTTPLITEATAQAIRGVDVDLIEMGRVFALPRRSIGLRIVLPMVAPPVLAATTVALGQSIRIAVMTELVATASGIGGALRLAQINIETPDVFAYAIVMTALTFVLERVLLAPVRRRMGARSSFS